MTKIEINKTFHQHSDGYIVKSIFVTMLQTFCSYAYIQLNVCFAMQILK